MKRSIITMSADAGEGHIPSALSILDILWVLYDGVLHIDPIHPGNPDRDRFILSKGHGTLGLYTILAEKGFFPYADLDTFASYESAFGGHPDCNKIAGIEASTGSLGHGFPMAIGIALGLKIQKKNCKVFTLIGDGECNEGTIWESALLAAHHRLSNLCCIIDYNHSTDRALQVGDLSKKFRAFGWESAIINGHNHEEIYRALTKAHKKRPAAIIAETIKGYGCKTMENNPEWHHKSPNKEELDGILEGLS
ncbi:MAG: transketolase [Proteobacteria bacterium]|nr:transketolase [Pseudomonadota bacterium]